MFDDLKRLFVKDKTPRSYKVPDGLAERICELQDRASGGSWVAQRELWRIVQARCPEAKLGKWKLKLQGNELRLVEVLA